jgi:hypothetical protein
LRYPNLRYPNFRYPNLRYPNFRYPNFRYPSFAVIEILAFSTFDTGQPFSAASAYF